MEVVHWRSVLSKTKRHSKLHEPRLQWHTLVLQWCLLLSSHLKGVLPWAQRTEVKKGQAAFTGELAQYIYMCKTKIGCSFTLSSLRGRGGVWKIIVTGKSSPKAVLDVGCPWGRGVQRLSPLTSVRDMSEELSQLHSTLCGRVRLLWDCTTVQLLPLPSPASLKSL